MGLLDFIKEMFGQEKATKENKVKEQPQAPPGYVDTGERINGIPVYHKVKESLSYADKERILVERMTAEDVRQFDKMPYDLNCPLLKFTNPNSHAFAYMNLTNENIAVAKAELEKINRVIEAAKSYVRSIPKWAKIDISKIAFHNYSPNYGYSRLMCTPYTFSGKIQKYPITLFFLSVNPDDLGYTVNGEIKYFADGSIDAATVNCWYRKTWSKDGDGWQYDLRAENGELQMYEIFSTIRPDEYGGPTSVYKSPQLLEYEKEREQEEKDYEWIKRNFPENSPKSVSSYRRMKTMNSTGYQKLKALAESKGKTI